LALGVLNNYEDAQDVTQDILEKLLKKQTNGYKSLEALSMKMTRDLCLDKIKHQVVKNEKLIVLKEQTNYDTQNYDIKHMAEISKTLIANLPEKQRMIIHLRDVEGYEFKEMEQILEMDINAIRMNLSRARKTVKEQLEKISNYGL
jgi:RNA polymerase sigma-70 factor (ECF subfamily)